MLGKMEFSAESDFPWKKMYEKSAPGKQIFRGIYLWFPYENSAMKIFPNKFLSDFPVKIPQNFSGFRRKISRKTDFTGKLSPISPWKQQLTEILSSKNGKN
jgi:hypothetical protein